VISILQKTRTEQSNKQKYQWFKQKPEEASEFNNQRCFDSSTRSLKPCRVEQSAPHENQQPLETLSCLPHLHPIHKVRKVLGGLRRYEGDILWRGNPWPLAILLMAIYESAKGKVDEARRLID
jgi:hypothetical protein